MERCTTQVNLKLREGLGNNMSREKLKHKNIDLFSECIYCLYSDICPRYESCEYLSPIDEEKYGQHLMEQLRATNFTSNRKYLPEGSSTKGMYDDNITPLYQYHRRIMNECLKNIRAGRMTYVYTKEELKTIMKYEPNINVLYQDGVFYITLE